jgi:hypothetical protein
MDILDNYLTHHNCYLYKDEDAQEIYMNNIELCNTIYKLDDVQNKIIELFTTTGGKRRNKRNTRRKN